MRIRATIAMCAMVASLAIPELGYAESHTSTALQSPPVRSLAASETRSGASLPIAHLSSIRAVDGASGAQGAAPLASPAVDPSDNNRCRRGDSNSTKKRCAMGWIIGAATATFVIAVALGMPGHSVSN